MSTSANVAGCVATNCVPFAIDTAGLQIYKTNRLATPPRACWRGAQGRVCDGATKALSRVYPRSAGCGVLKFCSTRSSGSWVLLPKQCQREVGVGNAYSRR